MTQDSADWMQVLRALPGWPADAVPVPGEQVFLAVVDLPLPGLRARAAAAPFAIEGALADPLAEVQVTLGPELAPRRHLVAAVRHAAMSDWVDALPGPRARLVPDILAVPRPDTGWAVWIVAGRAVVRSADGGGFAMAADSLQAAWTIAGRPAITAHGAALPAGVTGTRAPAPLVADPVTRVFDLRQGRHGRAGHRGGAALRQAGALVLTGAAIAAGLFAWDTALLLRTAAASQAEAAAMLARLVPGAAPGVDPVAVLERLAQTDPGADPGRFLPLLRQIAMALQPHAQGLAVQSLHYDAREATLALGLEAADLAALQRIEAVLQAAGLATTSGVATAGAAVAQVQMVIADPGGPT